MRRSNAARSALLLLLFTHAGVAAVSHSHTDDVDPMIGTDGGGQTTPNVGVPFGMTQWTPATRNGEVRLRAPYYYKDTELVGLRGSHFLSGSGTKDYGSFQHLAGMGEPDLSRGYLSTRLDHRLEESHPYLYKVTLPESGIRVSMTGTTRCGLLRFQFSRTDQRNGGHVDRGHPAAPIGAEDEQRQNTDETERVYFRGPFHRGEIIRVIGAKKSDRGDEVER